MCIILGVGLGIGLGLGLIRVGVRVRVRARVRVRVQVRVRAKIGPASDCTGLSQRAATITLALGLTHTPAWRS